jgi:uncharacterized protein (TIGR00369 family)
MDERATEVAFARALATHRPEFGHFFLARVLGLEFEYSEQACVIEFTLQDFMFNPQGSLHGGVIAMVMDISMGHLLNHVDGPGITVEMQTQYVRAARAGVLRCKGEFTARGRSISFLRSTLTDSEGDVIAFSTATWRRLRTA